MPTDVLFHDQRLEGLTPASTAGLLTVGVDDGTPLQTFFNRVIEISRNYGGIGNLKIMAHGLEGYDHEGGYGILFCRENINLETIGQAGDEEAGIAPSGFGLIRDMVETITLYVCASAASSRSITLTDGTTISGNGFEMCRRIAVNARAAVVASSEAQAYDSTPTAVRTFGSPNDPTGYCVGTPRALPLDFGEWEGRVYTFNEYGNIIQETVYPSAWRDGDGVIHDPRETAASSASSETPVTESWYCPVMRDFGL